MSEWDTYMYLPNVQKQVEYHSFVHLTVDSKKKYVYESAV